jgi:hypothetical protein
VQREITSIFNQNKVILRDTKRAVTPYGGLAVFVEYLRKIEYAETVRKLIPIEFTSPNAIDPTETFTAFLISVLSGARRFAHASLLRFDKALHCLLGIIRFPTDDTMRNLFKRFSQGKVSEFFSNLTQWQIQRLPERSEGYSLDLDSTVFERYGRQQGAVKGYNPKKHGRPSHHPLLAIFAEAHFVLHAWLRSGNCSSSRGVVEFLKEALAVLPKAYKIRVVRADSGFFDDKLLSFLEGMELSYIIVARMTRWIKNEARCIREWTDLDSTYSVAEFKMKLYGWTRERRIVVVRELVKDKPSMGRRLFNIPEYTFRLFVTSLPFAPEEIWRDYNQRSDMENRIAELKYDLAADDFCLKEFFATEAAFRSILLLFNLLSEFQRAAGMQEYKQPATLRVLVFLCGAVLGKSGRKQVLHMSSAWGGLETRNPLFEKILSCVFPTSPKLDLTMQNGCP